MSGTLCKYIHLPNKEAEESVGKLVDLLRATGFTFYTIAERSEGSKKFVDVKVSVKVSESK
jgi:hypothetical protein